MWINYQGLRSTFCFQRLFINSIYGDFQMPGFSKSSIKKVIAMIILGLVINILDIEKYLGVIEWQMAILLN